jgi:hypothetical protein
MRRARPTGEKGTGSVDVGGEAVVIAVAVTVVAMPRRRCLLGRGHQQDKIRGFF